MSRIAIIGAGAAGLAAAYGLRSAPVDVTVYEKSRGYGGRAASRGRYGHRYDHGANYFDPPTERVRRLVTAYLPTRTLVDIGRVVWTFDDQGRLTQEARPEGPKWTYRQGISTLGKLLARHSRAEVRTDTRIDRLTREAGAWTVRPEEGAPHRGYDAVVLTPPAPQATELLTEADAPPVVRAREALSAVSYTSQFSYVLGYDREIDRPGSAYGFVHRGDAHPLAWIGFEADKPGHVRAGHSVLVVQTGPAWTAPRVDADPDDFLTDVKDETAEVLGSDLRHLAWYDTQRWRYALPQSGSPFEAGGDWTELGLFLAGDFVVGTGRVGWALDTGLEAATRVQEWIVKQT